MANENPSAEATGFDQVLGFTIPGRSCRGRMVRLGPVLGMVLSAHDYPVVLKILLAEALTITSLMGGLLKNAGDQLTIQAQTEDGVVSLLVCDYRDGEIRGYVQFDENRFDGLGAEPSLEALFGKGHLAITFDIAATGQRYQGIVPLEGDSLARALEHYFVQSEQVPTIIRTGTALGPDGEIAAGILVQHLADGEDGRERLHVRLDHPDWEHVATLAATMTGEELVDEALPLEALVWRLFHEEEEVRTAPLTDLSRGCRCSELHFANVLAKFPKEDRREMADEHGIIRVDCAFCSKEFPIQD
tara:strand:+ start:592 stop:1497 length:906 start_codon:yes stop_codon:yes gene_type:complete